MGNVLILLSNHVANKAAAAIVSFTDPSDVAMSLKAFEFAPRSKE
jgi:hypothetical protein